MYFSKSFIKIYFHWDIFLLVILPNLLAFVGGNVFFPKEFDFFINLVEDLITQRSNSPEVSSLHINVLNVSNRRNFSFTQKYNDFVEVATEAIMEYTKTVGGKEVPIWTREEVDEIVTSQV